MFRRLCKVIILVSKFFNLIFERLAPPEYLYKFFLLLPFFTGLPFFFVRFVSLSVFVMVFWLIFLAISFWHSCNFVYNLKFSTFVEKNCVSRYCIRTYRYVKVFTIFLFCKLTLLSLVDVHNSFILSDYAHKMHFSV